MLEFVFELFDVALIQIRDYRDAIIIIVFTVMLMPGLLVMRQFGCCNPNPVTNMIEGFLQRLEAANIIYQWFPVVIHEVGEMQRWVGSQLFTITEHTGVLAETGPLGGPFVRIEKVLTDHLVPGIADNSERKIVSKRLAAQQADVVPAGTVVTRPLAEEFFDAGAPCLGDMHED